MRLSVRNEGFLMKFTKMHGCGNDYIFVDCIKNPLTEEEVKDLSRIAVVTSDRRTGIGADGIILIKPSTAADFEMEMYNSDGSMGEMCGNGIRCVGKYVYDYHLTEKTQIRIATKAGIKQLDLNVKDGMVETVRVHMGQPILTPEQIPVSYQGNEKQLIDYTIEAGGVFYQITCVSMGNPHAVLFLPEILRTDVKYIGSLLEHHKLFPHRTNVEFVHVINKNTIEMRVWERGSGETFACGTGACASVIASILHGYTENKVTVHLLGGDLLIEYDEEANAVFMTGPAVTVYDGETVDLLNSF